MKQAEKTIFEVRQIDAWQEYDGDGKSWYYNETFHLFDFSTCSNNEKRAFLNALKKHGISFYRGKIRVEYNGDFYEVVNRKTGEPLICAIPCCESWF